MLARLRKWLRRPVVIRIEPQVLELPPDVLVVVRLDRHLKREHLAAFRESVKPLAEKWGREVIVLPPGMDLELLQTDQAHASSQNHAADQRDEQLVAVAPKPCNGGLDHDA